MSFAHARFMLLTAGVISFGATSIAPATAQRAAFHHVHLTATDPGAAIEWYLKHMGGDPTKVGPFDAVGYGEVSFLFFKQKEGFEGSAGSVVDHIGFSFNDLEAKLKELEAGGVEIVSGIEQVASIKYAFVKDPWGTLVEVVEDPDLLGFHHVHIATTDPQEALSWYTKTFGGEITRFIGLIPAIRYGDVWILARKVREQQAPTRGRAIDHISWAFEDLDTAAEKLKAEGVKFDFGPIPFGGGKIAFIQSPEGVRIELVGGVSE